MPAIDSEAMRFAEYRHAAHELDITFSSGQTYTYFGVPKREYDGLKQASSAGGYFHTHIRDRYRFSRRRDLR